MPRTLCSLGLPDTHDDNYMASPQINKISKEQSPYTSRLEKGGASSHWLEGMGQINSDVPAKHTEMRVHRTLRGTARNYEWFSCLQTW